MPELKVTNNNNKMIPLHGISPLFSCDVSYGGVLGAALSSIVALPKGQRSEHYKTDSTGVLPAAVDALIFADMKHRLEAV